MTRLSVQGGGLGFISGRVYVKGGHKFREHQFSLPWVRITRCTVDLAKHRLHRRAPNTLCSAVRGHSQCSLAEECEFACSCERTVVQGPHALKTAAPHPSALSHPSATEPTGGESICMDLLDREAACHPVSSSACNRDCGPSHVHLDVASSAAPLHHCPGCLVWQTAAAARYYVDGSVSAPGAFFFDTAHTRSIS
jgi:hypothetical protein